MWERRFGLILQIFRGWDAHRIPRNLRAVPDCPHRKSTGLSMLGRIKSFGYALQGLLFALKTQANFRIHVVVAMAVIGLGLFWGVSGDDWRWLAVAIALVLAAELMNTALEHLCNVVQPELHASVKAAKDVAAGAVLVTAIAAAIIGALVFWPYISRQF
ncbi:MAG TPA: diacylglycerol kinase family protein [Hyphomonadaceae bacterium]|nr:diacylglycerol kinase family protein [Hyphomonadaceae bacterium]